MSVDARSPMTRRTLIALGIGSFVVAVVPYRLRQRLVRRTLPVMGTLAEVAVVSGDSRIAQVAIDAAMAELVRVDRTMSRFRADSDVGRANRRAFTERVTVQNDTAHVLVAALEWAEATSGRFDPCLGRSMELWDVLHRTEPPVAIVAEALAGRRLYQALDVRGESVRFDDPNVAIDLGGIAKGHGVDLAVQALKRFGIEHALVNVGGDLYALGSSPGGGPWRIGVRSPQSPKSITRAIEVSDGAIATSGDYEQGFDYRGRRYHHLLDPESGAPRITDLHTNTVCASTCLAADAGATATFGMEPEAATRMLLEGDSSARLIH